MYEKLINVECSRHNNLPDDVQYFAVPLQRHSELSTRKFQKW